MNHHHCIFELGESSLQRFLINKEKRVYQFPPTETKEVMVVRDVECGSKLKLSKKQLKKIRRSRNLNQEQIEIVNQTIDTCNEKLENVRKNMNIDTIILLYVTSSCFMIYKTMDFNSIFRYLIVGIMITGSVSFLIGYYVHYSPAILIGLIYIAGLVLLLWYSKRNSHEKLLSSHL